MTENERHIVQEEMKEELIRHEKNPLRVQELREMKAQSEEIIIGINQRIIELGSLL